METGASAREEAATGAQKPGLGPRVAGFLIRRREASIFVVAAALVAYFYARNPAFLTQGNIRTLAQFVATTAIIAAGLVMVMILGEIDLSVGQAYAFAPIVMWIAYEQFLLVLPLAVLIGLLATAVIGLINGLVTVYFRVPSFVTTLGMFFLLGGLNVILAGGFPKPAPEESALKSALGAYPWSGILWAAVIVGREIAVSALREWMAELGRRARVAVSRIGKFKTTLQMVAIVVLLLFPPATHPGASRFGVILLYGSALLTLWSMLVYLRAAWPELICPAPAPGGRRPPPES